MRLNPKRILLPGKVVMKIIIAACICVSLFITAGCSTKKNTAANRQWQAFNTRYNVYFNGIEHYKEQLKGMEENYEDDFTIDIPMHPSSAYADVKLPQPSGDFKRTMEKMQKAIQLHSITRKPARRTSTQKEREFRAREEFNPFLHNAWLTMAKAQYMQGDFAGAAATFQYISRHFTWLPEVVTEAKLWQARAFCALGWGYEAENILRLIKDKDLKNKDLRLNYNIAEGDYLMLTGRKEEAANFIKEAAEGSSGFQKHRLYFKLGQIYEYLGKREEAYEAFRKAGSGVSTPYRMKFNARIKQSEVFSGNDIRSEVKSLRAMMKYERNKDYLDRIYYAIGNLYLSRKDTTEAMTNYRMATEVSASNGIDKAMALLALGNIYFSRRDYLDAQPCYAEALPQLSEGYPGYADLVRKSDVLDELAVYAGNVALQDSLLKLSWMTEEERLAVVQRIVDNLIKEEKEAEEAARREEAMAERESLQPDNFQKNSLPGITFNNDKSWYFYNNMTKNAGKAEFQRRWGSRKLEDNWRRRNKNTFSFEDFDEDDDSEDSEEVGNEETPKAKEGENDPHYMEYYLKQIPKTDEERKNAEDIITEGMYNIAIILKDKLEDYPAARMEFAELLERFPDNVYCLDIYYNLYLMAVRDDNRTLAEEWRRKIVTRFPDSPYGTAMQDPEYFNRLRHMHEVQEERYERAYTAYLDNENETVHSLTEEMEKNYPLSPILPKFVFINALSYLTEGETDLFRDNLTELLNRWPDTDMTEMASAMLKGLKEGRELHAGETNTRGMLWRTRLSDEEETEPGENAESGFENDPDTPHYLVLVFPLDAVNPNVVLYEVARFNFSSFLVKDFDLEPMSFSNMGLLIVKGFANLKELENYRSVMEKGNLQLPEEVTPVMISTENFNLLIKKGRSFEDYFRFKEESDIEKIESLIEEGATEDVDDEP